MNSAQSNSLDRASARPRGAGSRRASLGLIAASLAALVTAGATGEAWAQEDGQIDRDFSAERFLLAGDRDGMLGVDAGTVIGHLNWELGFWIGLADDPLTVYQQDATGEYMRLDEPFLTRRIGGSLVGALGLGRRFQLGLQLPLVVDQTYEFSDDMYRPASSSGLGDARVLPKVQLLFRARHGVDLAIIPAITLPTGASLSYIGEEGLTFAPELAVSRYFGAARLAGNLGYRARADEITTGLLVADDLFGRVAAGYRFGDASTPVEDRPLELSLSLSLASRITDFLGKFNTNHLEMIGGGTYQVTPRWNILAGAGVGLNPGHGTPDWRLLASIRYTHDRPPFVPEPRRCPRYPEPRDPDCDGVLSVPEPALDPATGEPVVDPQTGRPVPVPIDPDVPDGPRQTFPITEEDWEKHYDYCPDVPGTVPFHGCPEPRVVVEDCSGIDVSPAIEFERGGEDIARPSKVPLEALARVLETRDATSSLPVEIVVSGPELAAAEVRAGMIKSFLMRRGASGDNLIVVPREAAGAGDGYQVEFAMTCPKVTIQSCGTTELTGSIEATPGISFVGETDEVDTMSRYALDELARQMTTKYPQKKMSILVAGPDVALAEKRANKLLAYLQGKGVEEVRLADVGGPGSLSGYSVVFQMECPENGEEKDGPCQRIELARKIQFDVNSAVIKQASLGMLKKDVVWVLQAHPEVHLVINGHTSTEGAADYNKGLSQRRSQSVVDYLVGQGIAADRLTPVGYGESSPLVPNEKTEADREKNRRIEFIVSEAGSCPCTPLKVGKIQFFFNSPRIKPESNPELNKVVRELEARPNVSLHIVGHTSSEGSRGSNKRLSQRRAAAVRTYLTKTGGVAARRLSSEGKGEDELLVPDDESVADPTEREANKEKNRRVEFIVKGGTCQAR